MLYKDRLSIFPPALGRRGFGWGVLLYHQPTQDEGQQDGKVVVGGAGEVEDAERGVVGEGGGGEDELGGDLRGVEAVALVHLGHVLGLGELDVHAVVERGAVYGR